MTAKPPKRPPAGPDQKTSSDVRARRIGYDLRDHLTHERTIAEVVAAFEAAKGAPIATAEILGVNYEQVRRWTQEHPALRARLDEIQERAGWVRRGPTSAGAKRKRSKKA